MTRRDSDGDGTDEDPTVWTAARTLADVGARPTGALLVLAGLLHLVAPRVLLRIARVAYARVLDVRFEAGPGAPTRVRLVGSGMFAAGTHLLYHGGIRPGDPEDQGNPGDTEG